jgi:hypothetical protein
VKAADLLACTCEGQIDLTDLVDNEHIPGSMRPTGQCPTCLVPLQPDGPCHHCGVNPDA